MYIDVETGLNVYLEDGTEISDNRVCDCDFVKGEVLILAYLIYMTLMKLHSIPGASLKVKNDQVENVKTKSYLICNTNESGHFNIDI